MRRSALVLGIVLSMLVAMPVFADKPVKDYVVHLEELNDSGVEGTVRLSLDGDQLTVSVQATGLEPNMLHPQHIHGFTVENMGNARNATCPTMEFDTNDDGLVDLGEGVPAYGPVLLSLTPFPTADSDGNVSFEQTYTVDRKMLGPLQKRAIVLHGLTVEGTYVPTLPVACGPIQVMPSSN